MIRITDGAYPEESRGQMTLSFQKEEELGKTKNQKS